MSSSPCSKSCAERAGALRPAHRSGARLCPGEARAAGHSVPSRFARLAQRAGPRLPRARRAALVTSRQEGGPKTVLESLATGIPLVTTRVGQATDLVADGDNGLLADVDDVAALAAAVSRIHDDAELVPRWRARPADRRSQCRGAARPALGAASRRVRRERADGRDGARIGRYLRAARRWAVAAAAASTGRTARVLRARSRAGSGRAVAGGTAKVQRLAERFPNSPADFTLLYLGSTWLPRISTRSCGSRSGGAFQSSSTRMASPTRVGLASRPAS